MSGVPQQSRETLLPYTFVGSKCRLELASTHLRFSFRSHSKMARKNKDPRKMTKKQKEDVEILALQRRVVEEAPPVGTVSLKLKSFAELPISNLTQSGNCIGAGRVLPNFKQGCKIAVFLQ